MILFFLAIKHLQEYIPAKSLQQNNNYKVFSKNLLFAEVLCEPEHEYQFPILRKLQIKEYFQLMPKQNHIPEDQNYLENHQSHASFYKELK